MKAVNLIAVLLLTSSILASAEVRISGQVDLVTAKITQADTQKWEKYTIKEQRDRWANACRNYPKIQTDNKARCAWAAKTDGSAWHPVVKITNAQIQSWSKLSAADQRKKWLDACKNDPAIKPAHPARCDWVTRTNVAWSFYQETLPISRAEEESWRTLSTADERANWQSACKNPKTKAAWPARCEWAAKTDGSTWHNFQTKATVTPAVVTNWSKLSVEGERNNWLNACKNDNNKKAFPAIDLFKKMSTAT